MIEASGTLIVVVLMVRVIMTGRSKAVHRARRANRENQRPWIDRRRHQHIAHWHERARNQRE